MTSLESAPAREAGAEWLDLNRAFTEERGVLSKELSKDLLHLTERGYEVWANALRDPSKRWCSRPGSGRGHKGPLSACDVDSKLAQALGAEEG